MASTPFSGTPLFFEPAVFDTDLGGPGCMYGITVGKAGTVNVLQRNNTQRAFTVAAADNIQGDFKQILSSGTTGLVAADISIARR